MTRTYTVDTTVEDMSMCCVCEEFYDIDTITTINNETFCEDCYNDNYQTCNICFDNKLNKDIIYCDDCGQPYCYDCFKGDNDICHDCIHKNNCQDITYIKHVNYNGDNNYCLVCNEMEEDMSDYNESGHKICQNCFEAKFDCCNDCGYIVHDIIDTEFGVCCVRCYKDNDIYR